jgi:D-aminopeptidase
MRNALMVMAAAMLEVWPQITTAAISQSEGSLSMACMRPATVAMAVKYAVAYPANLTRDRAWRSPAQRSAVSVGLAAGFGLLARASWAERHCERRRLAARTLSRVRGGQFVAAAQQ